MIQVIELFAGIGAQAMALKMAGIDYHVVAVSEIDQKAITGYQAIHGPVDNLGDITKIEELPECDLLTYSWPCQSVSVAGKRTGMVKDSGTTSSLLWEVGRLLAISKEKGKLPNVLVAENVDAVLNKVNYLEFKKWVVFLSDLGYNSTYKVMNAKEYGTPQNRRRLFMVSSLNNNKFIFPQKTPDGRLLKDVLEKEIDDRYYLSSKLIQSFKERNERIKDKKGFIWTYTDGESVAKTLTTKRDHSTANYIKDDHGIRYLTPRECFRLQAFPEYAIDSILSCGLSNVVLYRLAGNSIPVCCLKAIFTGIYKDHSFRERDRQITLANWVKDTGVSV